MDVWQAVGVLNLLWEDVKLISIVHYSLIWPFLLVFFLTCNVHAGALMHERTVLSGRSEVWEEQQLLGLL